MESLCADTILNQITDNSVLNRIKNTSFSFLKVNNYDYLKEEEHIKKIGFEKYLEEESPVLGKIDDETFNLHYKRKIFNNSRTNMSYIYSKKDD